MKEMQSFLMLFYILDQCFDHCQENDLGSILGAMSPEFMDDGLPMDKAIYNDWVEHTDVALLNKESIVQEVYRFLEYYESEFEYCFEKTKEVLQDPSGSLVDMVEKAVMRTEEMYQRHSYDN